MINVLALIALVAGIGAGVALVVHMAFESRRIGDEDPDD